MATSPVPIVGLPQRQRSLSLSAACAKGKVPGTPLGSLTARLASKSFWGQGMLEECLKQIFHTALQEKHGSTTKHDENFTDHLSWKHDSESEKDEEEERDFQNAQDTNSSVNSDTSYKLRELKNPIWEYDTRDDGSRHNGGYQTPPYMSPGITKRLNLRYL